MQDLTMFFGSDRGRFYEIQKRSVQDKFLGSFVKTVMTRCIHCTRCVRFLQEVTGDYNLGLTGRGGKMEITTYVSKNLHEELSANIIDICPVGALTSKPYAFKARPWEAKQICSIDVFDTLCSPIRIDVFNNKILRILPISNSYLNEDWITNKIRFCYDCFNIQRITSPLYRTTKNLLLRCSWKKIFKYLSLVFFQSYVHNIEAVLGDLDDLTSLQALKDFMNIFGSSNITADTHLENVDFRSSYLLNLSIYEIEHLNLVVLIGVNARFDFPLLNFRLRKRFLKGGFKIFTFGQGINYFTFPVKNIGNLTSMLNYIKGMSTLCKLSLNDKNSRVFLGKSNIRSYDFNCVFKVLNFCNNFLKREDFVCVLENQTGLLNSYDLGLLCSKNKLKSYYFDTKWYKMFFVLNNNNFIKKILQKKNKFIVSIDSHGYQSTTHSNIILPISTFVESEGLYLNLEGLAQVTNIALPSVGDSRELKSLLKALQIYFLLTNMYVGKNLEAKIDQKVLTTLSGRFLETLPIFNYSKHYIYFFNMISYDIILKFRLKLYDSAIYNYYKSSSILSNSVILLNIKELTQANFSDYNNKY